MPKKAPSVKKKPATKPAAAVTEPSAESPRRLHLPKRVWYKPLTWRYIPPAPAYAPLSKVRILFARTMRQLWRHKGLFGGIVAVYGLLNILLVRSIVGSSDLQSIKTSLDSLSQGAGGKFLSTLGSFGYLVATSGSGSAQAATAYQTLLLTICSLAFIWAFRQVLAEHVVRIRDSFYLGMYPLIPFMLVFLFIGLQLLPLVVGVGFYQVVLANGIAISFWEKALCFITLVGLGYWSLRMITGSLFAAYIVTLPDMTPMRAIREGKRLVYGRRLLVWRKLIFLPVVLLLLAAAIEFPLILWLTPVAPWVFFLISMVALPIIHGYVYNQYREML
jgi:hypothetical protein